MNVNNASNGGMVHRLFFVNWIASCPLGALNQVLARCVIQRIRNISSRTKEWNHFSAAWIKTIAAGDLSCWSKPNRWRATTEEENANCSTSFLDLHHNKNLFISLRYFFIVEYALELSKQVNKELKPDLIAGGGTIHTLLAIKTCKKKKYHKSFTTTG